jgi:NAD(P)H-hydrate repair Nnr-like enzyme with NAD(P)H-hydrate epimerase domain
MFEYAGGRTISSISQLPNDKPIDLIIDALMGVQYSYKDLQHDKKAHQLTTTLISWANANAAPILSLDFPSGNQHSQGM